MDVDGSADNHQDPWPTAEQLRNDLPLYLYICTSVDVENLDVQCALDELGNVFPTDFPHLRAAVEHLKTAMPSFDAPMD